MTSLTQAKFSQLFSLITSFTQSIALLQQKKGAKERFKNKKTIERNHICHGFYRMPVLVTDPFRVFAYRRMALVLSWYIMPQVLFSSSQFKFAQCFIHSGIGKKAKHK